MDEQDRIKQAMERARKRYIECEPDSQPSFSELARDEKIPAKLIEGMAKKEDWKTQHKGWWENEKKRRILAIQANLESEYQKGLANTPARLEKEKFLDLIRLMIGKIEEKLLGEPAEDISFYHLAQGSSAIQALWKSYAEIRGDLYAAIEILAEREVLDGQALTEIENAILEAEKFTAERMQHVLFK